MLDFSHLAQTSSTNNQQIIYANSLTNGGNWTVWQKPRGANFLNVFLLAGGGGGGAGAAPAALGSSGGGGGGGSSAQFYATYNLWALPDNLYISVGVGGAPGTAGSGTAGINSYISIDRTTTSNCLLAIVNSGGGGTTGGAGSGGNGGTGGTAVGISSMPLLGLAAVSWSGSGSNVSCLPGQGGVTGSYTTAGNGLTMLTTGLIVTGGTGGAGLGGAGTTGNGTNGITSLLPTYSAPIGSFSPGSTTANVNNGSNGYMQTRPYYPLQFYGGTGGGSGGATSTAGGSGGAGSFGCGGAGGSGTFTGSTRAAGGRGGNGLCILTWW